jgi:ATP-dependent Clp protease protease subunit
MIPFVVSKEQEEQLAYDIFARLLKDRVIFLTGEVEDKKSDAIVAQLLYLDSVDPDKDITLYINSPGGVVSGGLAIYDAMQFVHADVSTVCIGQAASMAAVLLAAGAPKKRFALPNARVLIHQPLGGAYGVATDVVIQTHEILRLKKRLHEIMAQHTGQTFEKIAGDTERDFFMSAEEAKAYGLIDKVIGKKPGRK